MESISFGEFARHVKTLLLLRHAKSSWEDRSLSDHDRPLNERGERDAPRMGRLLRDENRWPDLILSSTATRARRTTQLLIEAVDRETEVRYLSKLYLAEPEDYVEAVRRVGGEADSVLLVGHNPGLEMLVQRLTGEWHRLPTAALVCVTLPIDTWKDLEASDGRLAGLWLPRKQE